MPPLIYFVSSSYVGRSYPLGTITELPAEASDLLYESASLRKNQSGWVKVSFEMPTVLMFDGFRVRIYPNDHEPAHVHVINAGEEALFYIGGPNGPIELRENFGFR